MTNLNKIENKSIHVLLIEDDPVDADLLQEILELSNNVTFEVTWMDRLKKGLEYLEKETVDTILSDLSLPDSHGLTTFQQVYQQAPETPIIVLSGLDDKTIALQAVQQGAQDYLAKGNINSDLVEQTIRYAIERKRKEKELNELNHNLTVLNRQMTEELKQAQVTQLTLLPQKIPELPGIQLTAKYVPFNQIGGDFYDILKFREEKTGILIADVSGHGISAALLSFMISGLFKNLVPGTASPASVIQALNDSVYEKIPEDKFATAFYCVYDAKIRLLTYVSAGHPPGYVVRTTQESLEMPPATGTPLRRTAAAGSPGAGSPAAGSPLRRTAGEPEIFPLPNTGMVLGAFPTDTISYEQKSFQLIPGDKLILYTDGIVEIQDASQSMFGLSRFKQLLLFCSHLPLNEMLETIYDTILEFSENKNFHDDITLVGLEVKE